MKGLYAAVAVLAISAGAVPASAQQLPDRIAQAKVVKIAVNAIYPPMEYKDPQTNKLVGFDIDLGEAMAKQLGVTLEWQEYAFEQLITAVTTHRADMILSGLTDRPQRRETLDFIDYMRSGPQFIVRADRAGDFKSPLDLCGKTVGTSRSTSFPAEIESWSKANCEAAGKPAVKVAGAESTADARLQLKQQRIDAAAQGSETIPYVISLEPNSFTTVGEPISRVVQGMAFAKGDTQLRDAFAGALRTLIANGTYRQIVQKWKQDANTIDGVLLNGEPMN